MSDDTQGTQGAPAPDNGQDLKKGSDTQPAASSLPPDLSEKLANLIERQGGLEQVAVTLYQDNYKLREKLREARERIPPEGAVVLTGDQASAWQRLQELLAEYESPDALVQALQGGREAQERLGALERQQLIQQAASLHGYKPSVLQELVKDLQLEIREEGEGREKERVAYVVLEGGEAKPLPDWLQAEKADFLPALVVEDDRRNGARGLGPRPQPAGIGVDRQKAVQAQRRLVRKVF